MTSQSTRYCQKCQKQVTFHFDRVRHGKQLLLSIVTCGLWLPMWLSMVLAPTKICDECNEALWGDETSSK